MSGPAFGGTRSVLWLLAMSTIALTFLPVMMNCVSAVGAHEGNETPYPPLAQLNGFASLDDSSGQVGQPAVVLPGVGSEQGEGLIHIEPTAFGDDTLGLLNDYPAIERCLELLGKGLVTLDGAGLENADGRDVSQGLSQPKGVRIQCPWSGAEQVQCPDHVVAQPHGQGMDGHESAAESLGRELGPALDLGCQIGHGDRVAGVEAFGAGALVGLQLEEFQQPGLLGRSRHHPQRAPQIGEHHPSGRHIDHGGASESDQLEEVHDVVVVYKGIGELYEGLGRLVAAHVIPNPSPGVLSLLPK